MNDVTFRMKAADDKMASDASELEFRKRLTAMGEAEDGFQNLQGGNATYEARDNYIRNVEKMRNEVGKSLLPGPQAGKYMSTTNQYLQRENQTTASHAAEQRKVYQGTIYDAAVIQAQEDVARFSSEPQPYIDQIIRNTTDKANMMGLPEDAREVAVEAAVSAAHQSAIGVLLNNKNTEGAAAYLDRWGTEILPEQRSELSLKVNSSADLEVSQKYSAELVGKPLNLMERRAAARRDLEGEPLKLALSQIDHDFAVEKSAKADAVNLSVGRVIQNMAEHPEKSWLQVRDELGAEEWSKIESDPASLKMIMGGAGNLVESDQKTRWEVMGMLSDPSYTKQNIADAIKKSAGKLSRNDQDLFFNMANKVAPGQKRPMKTPLMHFNDGVKEYLGPRASKNTKSYDDWGIRKNILYGMYADKVAAWELNPDNKRYGNVPDDVSRKFAAEVFWEYNQVTTLFGIDMLSGDLDVNINSIPVDELEDIITELAAEGSPTTTNYIIEEYVHRKGY
jgi:hypothetical protein